MDRVRGEEPAGWERDPPVREHADSALMQHPLLFEVAVHGRFLVLYHRLGGKSVISSHTDVVEMTILAVRCR